MSIRAILFDVYQTLLKVGPPPADAESRWETLRSSLPGLRPLSLHAYQEQARAAIAAEHEKARDAGISHPEIYWPEIASSVLLPGGSIAPEVWDRFLLEHAQLVRTIELMPGAAALLKEVRGSVRLGIASNAQPYTLHEWTRALASAGLDATLFEEDLCFWSFRHGFSKPDPHVFRMLEARLRIRGIAGGEVLMVGDRLDNDLEPARRQGWKTWRIDPQDPEACWEELRVRLGGGGAGL